MSSALTHLISLIQNTAHDDGTGHISPKYNQPVDLLQCLLGSQHQLMCPHAVPQFHDVTWIVRLQFGESVGETTQ